MKQKGITTRQIEEYRRKNIIINGNFSVWQRGKTFGVGASGSPEVPGTGEYTADRWFVNAGSPSGGGTVTREEFIVGQTDVEANPTYYLRYTHNGGDISSDAPFIYQRIEDYRTFANKVVTVSFYMKGTPGIDVNVSLIQSATGSTSSGSPTPFAFNSVGSFNLSSSWEKKIFTLQLSDLSTINAIPTNASHLQLAIGTTTSGSPLMQVGDFFDIAQVQVERGSAVSSFEYRNIGEELTLCQRYYQKSYEPDIDPGTSGQQNTGHPHFHSDTTTSMAGDLRFPVPMRDTPAVIIYRPSTGEINRIESVPEVDPGDDVSSIERGSDGIGLVIMDSGVLNGSFPVPYQFHYTADAEL